MVQTSIERLFGSKEIYRTIIDSAEEGIWIADKDGVITYVNKKMIDLLGYDKEQIIGKKMFDFTDDENRSIMKKSLEESRKGKRDNYSYSLRNIRGEFIPMMVATTPMQDEHGQYIGTVELMSDMSGQKMVEDELREREDHLKIAQEIAHLGSWVWDIRTDKQVWSDERYRIFGLSSGEIEPTLEVYLNFIHPEERASVEKALFAAIREKKPFTADYRIVRKDGSIRYMHSEGHVKYDEKGKPVKLYAIGQDISERKRVELKLAEQTKKLQEQSLIIDLAHVIIRDPGNRIVHWSSGDEKLYGYTKDEALGQVSHELFRTIFPVSKNAVDHALENKGEWDGELIYMAKDGHQVFVVSHQVLYRENGSPTAILEVNNIITKQKQLERELTDAKNRAELYLDLLGHDINNMNQIAMGFLEVALERFPLNAEEREFLEKPLDTLKNSAKLIDNVRKLQKLEEGGLKHREVDLCGILSEVIADYSNIPGRNVTINYRPLPGCYVVANELIRDVFSNLIINSIKHSGSQQHLTINIGLDQVTEKGTDYYRVTVEDDGPGIPDDLKNRLFMRFQRGQTKAIGKGLGLYLVRTLVNGFHGKIWVEDRASGDHTKGARFVVMLPAVENH